VVGGSGIPAPAFSNRFPATHPVAVPTPAGWDANVDVFRRKYNLGFPFATESPYDGS